MPASSPRPERATQNRVIALFTDVAWAGCLGYKYLYRDNWGDRVGLPAVDDIDTKNALKSRLERNAMMKRRKSHNPKRHLAQGLSVDYCAALARRIRYTGNPEHKRNPGDFGLHPPAASCRPDKALCDGTGIVKRADAQALLRDGAQRGLVSRQWPNDRFPQNIWAVAPSGHALEAQLENAETGDYHGYPLPESDPFAEVLRKHWSGV